MRTRRITNPMELARARKEQDHYRRHWAPDARVVVAETDAMAELGVRLCVDADGAWFLTRRRTSRDEPTLAGGAPEIIVLREQAHT